MATPARDGPVPRQMLLRSLGRHRPETPHGVTPLVQAMLGLGPEPMLGLLALAFATVAGVQQPSSSSSMPLVALTMSVAELS